MGPGIVCAIDSVTALSRNDQKHHGTSIVDEMVQNLSWPTLGQRCKLAQLTTIYSHQQPSKDTQNSNRKLTGRILVLADWAYNRTSRLGVKHQAAYRATTRTKVQSEVWPWPVLQAVCMQDRTRIQKDKLCPQEQQRDWHQNSLPQETRLAAFMMPSSRGCWVSKFGFCVPLRPQKP